MKIYSSDTTNFQNNGLGFLTDVISAVVHEELNGNYYLEFEYLLNGHLSEYLLTDNIVKCKVSDGTEQLFIITQIDKDLETISVTAKHIFYRLLNNFLEDVYPQNLSGQPFLEWILEHTAYNSGFTAFSDITNVRSARYVRKNPVEAIIGASNSMVNIFGGELKRDNFRINFLSRIGANKQEKLIFGKNIKQIKITIDTSSILTRIMPMGYDGLLLPEKYIDSPIIDNYNYPRIGIVEFDEIVYDPEDEDAYHDIEEAYQALRDETNKLWESGVDKSLVNIKINWLELSKTNEYKNYSNLEKLQLGDSVVCDIAGFNYNTRVISTKYNVLTDMIDNYEIGTYSANIATSMNNFTTKLEKVNPTSILQYAKDNATSLITQAMGGYIYKTQSELYIMDTDNPTTAQRVWRWNINGLGYSKNGINGPYELAMTMDGSIVADMITTGTLNTNVIKGYDQLVITVNGYDGRISQINQTVSELNAKISDIADITVSGDDVDGSVELNNINTSEPITVIVRPIGENISYLYPHSNLFPSDDLFLKTRNIRFIRKYTENGANKTQNIDYELPDDLLIYDENTYDEFYLDYDSHICKVTKRCKYNADGSVGLLDEEITVEYPYPQINLPDGDYTICLLGYTTGYLFVRLMAQNIYTTQFATRVEMKSEINLTKEQIESTVSETYATKDTTNELSSRIRQTARSIELAVSDNSTSAGITIKLKNENGDQLDVQTANITMRGLVKFTDLSGNDSSTIINGSNIRTGTINASVVAVTNINANNITTGTISTNRLESKVITTDNFSAQNINANRITTGTITAAAINLGNGKFSVNTNGYLYSISGSIGGFTIASRHLRASNNNGFVGLGTDVSGSTPAVYCENSNGDYWALMSYRGFQNGSLEKYKKNFKLLKNALKIVTDSDIYEYNYVDEKSKAKKHIGIVIGENYNYSKKITNDKNNGVDLYSMIAVAYGAIQELNDKLERKLK